jgi:TctA family transporter
MKAWSYLILSASVFLTTAVVYVASFKWEVPSLALQVLVGATAVCLLPMVRLFLRARGETKAEADVTKNAVWVRFWDKALRYCPRWIWGSMTIAVLLWIFCLVAPLLRLEQKDRDAGLAAAYLLVFAGAALSYAVTLVKTPQQGAD